MKSLYYIGLGPQRFISAELKPFYKGWMITRIFVSEGAKGGDHDLDIIRDVMDDADKEGVILYLDEHIWANRETRRYIPLGFRVYKSLIRRRPIVKGKEKL